MFAWLCTDRVMCQVAVVHQSGLEEIFVAAHTVMWPDDATSTMPRSTLSTLTNRGELEEWHLASHNTTTRTRTTMAITTTRRMGELSKWETSWPQPPPPYACCHCRRWWWQRWSEVCFFVWISLFLLLIFVSTARRQWRQCSVAITTPPMPLNDNLQAPVSSTPGQNVCFVFS